MYDIILLEFKKSFRSSDKMKIGNNVKINKNDELYT